MSRTARNLTKDELGAVIFGCKNHTIMECLDNLIFGLPDTHHSYVKNVTPGLTLYLFNYSDRKLHGIFEAVSTGQRNINPRAWAASEGVAVTPYPSQVRVREQSKCRPLLEEEFKHVIASNYYADKFFRFELDHEQNRRLMELFLPSPMPKKVPHLPNVARKTFECLSISNANKNAVEEIKCGDSEEYSEVADLKLRENKDSYSSVYYKDSLDSEKNWSELFKPSSSSCVVKNKEDLKYQKVEPKSTISDSFDSEWKFASSSGGWSNPPSEACLNDCDPCVLGSLEGNAFVDHGLEEINENKVQYSQFQDSQCQDSDSDKPNMTEGEYQPSQTDYLLAECEEGEYQPNMTEAFSENRIFLDERGEYQPSELDSFLVEGKDLNDTEEIVRSGTDFPTVENCERNQDQFNLTDKAFQEDKNDMPAAWMTKLMQEVGVLKLSQVKQRLRIESLEYELVQSKVEIDQLKSRCKFDSVLASSRDNCKREDSASPNLKPEDSVFVIGGFNGCSWLSDLSLYYPSKDHVVSLCPMTFTRSNASLAKLNGVSFTSLVVLMMVCGMTQLNHITHSIIGGSSGLV